MPFISQDFYVPATIPPIVFSNMKQKKVMLPTTVVSECFCEQLMNVEKIQDNKSMQKVFFKRIAIASSKFIF